jgi:hypothetical protein
MSFDDPRPPDYDPLFEGIGIMVVVTAAILFLFSSSRSGLPSSKLMNGVRMFCMVRISAVVRDEISRPISRFKPLVRIETSSQSCEKK